MKLIEYLSDIPTETKTKRMLKLFDGLWKVHNYNVNNPNLYEQNPGYYFTKDLREVDVNEEGLYFIDDNSVDKIIDEDSIRKRNWDIIELCVICICSYDNIHEYFNFSNDFSRTMNFIYGIRQYLNKYVENDRIPEVMKEYFIDVLERGNYEYANFYYFKNYSGKEVNDGNERARVKTKSTAAGRAMAAYEKKEAAYVNVLLVPGLIIMIYLMILAITFIFF